MKPLTNLFDITSQNVKRTVCLLDGTFEIQYVELEGDEEATPFLVFEGRTYVQVHRSIEATGVDGTLWKYARVYTGEDALRFHGMAVLLGALPCGHDVDALERVKGLPTCCECLREIEERHRQASIALNKMRDERIHALEERK